MATANTRLTREDLTRLVGEVDDLLAADVLATGASVEELAEAVRDLERETVAGETAPPASTPRVAALRGLLEGPLAGDRWADDDDYRD